MPFVNGFFTRLFSWRDDRDAGVKIRADRMDQETDGIVDGINAVVRGEAPFQGPIRTIYGTEATPAYSFTDDSDTGLYHATDGQIAVTLGGAKAAEFLPDRLNVLGARVWTAGNDGAGSGLDADTLDGLQASAFLRTDGVAADSAKLGGVAASQYITRSGSGINADTLDGYDSSQFLKLTATASLSNWLGIAAPTDHQLFIGWNTGTTINPRIDLHDGGTGVRGTIQAFSGRFRIKGQSAYLDLLSGSQAEISGYTLWHAGNDGSGSGLDADTLDGLHASAFLRSTAKAADADKLDGLTSTDFLRTNTNTTKTSGYLRFNDNVQMQLGSGGDVELFCNGSHAYIDLNAGIGNLYIRDGSSTRFTFDDAGHFTATGDVTAYSDARLKDNVQTLDGRKVLAMRGVSYLKDGQPSAGVIAQELQEIAPELVHETGDYLSVAYGNLAGYLIEAIKAQQSEMDQLRADLAEMKAGLDRHYRPDE